MTEVTMNEILAAINAEANEIHQVPIPSQPPPPGEIGMLRDLSPQAYREEKLGFKSVKPENVITKIKNKDIDKKDIGEIVTTVTLTALTTAEVFAIVVAFLGVIAVKAIGAMEIKITNSLLNWTIWGMIYTPREAGDIFVGTQSVADYVDAQRKNYEGIKYDKKYSFDEIESALMELQEMNVVDRNEEDGRWRLKEKYKLAN